MNLTITVGANLVVVRVNGRAGIFASNRIPKAGPSR